MLDVKTMYIDKRDAWGIFGRTDTHGLVNPITEEQIQAIVDKATLLYYDKYLRTGAKETCLPVRAGVVLVNTKMSGIYLADGKETWFKVNNIAVPKFGLTEDVRQFPSVTAGIYYTMMQALWKCFDGYTNTPTYTNMIHADGTKTASAEQVTTVLDHLGFDCYGKNMAGMIMKNFMWKCSQGTSRSELFISTIKEPLRYIMNNQDGITIFTTIMVNPRRASRAVLLERHEFDLVKQYRKEGTFFHEVESMENKAIKHNAFPNDYAEIDERVDRYQESLTSIMEAFTIVETIGYPKP